MAQNDTNLFWEILHSFNLGKCFCSCRRTSVLEAEGRQWNAGGSNAEPGRCHIETEGEVSLCRTTFTQEPPQLNAFSSSRTPFCSHSVLVQSRWTELKHALNHNICLSLCV